MQSRNKLFRIFVSLLILIQQINVSFPVYAADDNLSSGRGTYRPEVRANHRPAPSSELAPENLPPDPSAQFLSESQIIQVDSIPTSAPPPVETTLWNPFIEEPVVNDLEKKVVDLVIKSFGGSGLPVGSSIIRAFEEYSIWNVEIKLNDSQDINSIQEKFFTVLENYDGSIYIREILERNFQDQILVGNYFNPDGSLTQKSNFNYHSNGRLANSSSLHYQNGILKTSNGMQYGDDGQWKMSYLSFYNDEGKIRHNESSTLHFGKVYGHIGTYEFNDHGQIIKEEIYSTVSDDVVDHWVFEYSYFNGSSIAIKDYSSKQLDSTNSVKNETHHTYNEAGITTRAEIIVYENKLPSFHSVWTFNNAGELIQLIDLLKPPITPQAPKSPEAPNLQFTLNEDASLNESVNPAAEGFDPFSNTGLPQYLLVEGVKNGTLNFYPDGSYTYKPNSDFNGTDFFTYKVVEDGLESNVARVDLTINSANDKPILEAIGTKTIPEGQIISIDLKASDVDNDHLSFSVTGLPTGAKFEGKTFSWTPTSIQSGTYFVTFEVSDNQVPALVASEVVKITVGNVNRDPTADLTNVDATEDATKTFTLTGSDLDGDSLTYSIRTHPTKGTLNCANIQCTYQPNANANGQDSFTYRVHDGTTFSDSTVTINVGAVNDDPILNAIGPKTISENELFTFVLNGSDVDGNSLTYSVSGLPSNVVIDGSQFAWMPNFNQAGTYNATFEVSDGIKTVSQDVVFTVKDVSEGTGSTINPNPTDNQTPVMGWLPDTWPTTTRERDRWVENAEKQFGLTATDSDSTNLTFSFKSDTGVLERSGARIDQAKKMFIWKPDSSSQGEHIVTFTVSDGFSTDSRTVKIIISNINIAPIGASEPVNAIAGEPIDIVVGGSDADGDVLKDFKVNSNPTNGILEKIDSNRYRYTPHSTFSGRDFFSFQVFDGVSWSAAEWAKIYVELPGDSANPILDTFEVIPYFDYITSANGSISGKLEVADSGSSQGYSFYEVGAYNGTVEIIGDTFTYTPHPGYFGDDQFMFRARRNGTKQFSERGTGDIFGIYGVGQTVAILDTGIDQSHLAFAGRVSGDDDLAGHGTHVAGIIGSADPNNPGIAPGVNLIGYRVIGDFSTTAYDALNQIANSGLGITTVNMSFSYLVNHNENFISDNSLPGQSTFNFLNSATSTLSNRGITLIAAAGNKFPNYNTPGIAYPASAPGVIPVMNYDSSVGGLHFSSQRHTSAIAADGTHITSSFLDDQFISTSGTSMAAPLISGAAVLIREVLSGMGIYKDIYQHMRDTADSFWDSATNTNYLRLNLDRALDSIFVGSRFDRSKTSAFGSLSLGPLGIGEASHPFIGMLSLDLTNDLMPESPITTLPLAINAKKITPWEDRAPLTIKPLSPSQNDFELGGLEHFGFKRKEIEEDSIETDLKNPLQDLLLEPWNFSAQIERPALFDLGQGVYLEKTTNYGFSGEVVGFTLWVWDESGNLVATETLSPWALFMMESDPEFMNQQIAELAALQKSIKP